jgi:hypothetical protein
VGNLRKEEMMNHVPITDVVMQTIDAVAIRAVDRFEPSLQKRPIFIAVDPGANIVMLQVGHHEQPKPEHGVTPTVAQRDPRRRPFA